MVDPPPDDPSTVGAAAGDPGQLIPTEALAQAEVVDLATSSEPYQQVPPHLRPRSALPGQELLRILGPFLVCRIVLELEQIYDREASTHIDMRIHTARGLPHRVDVCPVQAYAASRPTFGASPRR